MHITRRDALLGATAAAVVTGAVAAPGVKAALAGDPVIGLSRQLRAVWEAWMSAQDVYEEAAHRVGLSICYGAGLVTVESSHGLCTWGAEEIKAAAEDGRRYHKLTPEERDAALAKIEWEKNAAHKKRRQLGIEPLWQEEQRLKAQFWDLHARLLDMPAATSSGVLAKLRGFYHDGEIAQIRAGDDPVEDLPAEWAASVYRDLERLAGEG